MNANEFPLYPESGHWLSGVSTSTPSRLFRRLRRIFTVVRIQDLNRLRLASGLGPAGLIERENCGHAASGDSQ
jgi:hypothetical protein